VFSRSMGTRRSLSRGAKRALIAGVVGLLFLALVAGPAVAQAIVQKGFFTGGPVFTPLGAGTITNSNYVQTPSGNWTITVQGRLNDLNNAPSSAQRWTQNTLATFCFQPGDVFTLVVTPSGNINLSCKNP
jgi:hypothetical protein